MTGPVVLDHQNCWLADGTLPYVGPVILRDTSNLFSAHTRLPEYFNKSRAVTVKLHNTTYHKILKLLKVVSLLIFQNSFNCIAKFKNVASSVISPSLVAHSFLGTNEKSWGTSHVCDSVTGNF